MTELLSVAMVADISQASAQLVNNNVSVKSASAKERRRADSFQHCAS